MYWVLGFVGLGGARAGRHGIKAIYLLIEFDTCLRR